MGAVDVIILHPSPGPDAGLLESALADARVIVADRQRAGFLAIGAASARVVSEAPDGRPFGARLREARTAVRPGRGLVLLGSGALPLATAADRRRFVVAAAAVTPGALANNRYSADAVALSAPAVDLLDGLPDAFPGDNALPRWLAEVGGVPVRDLRRSWRLAVDLDSPLDVLLVAMGARPRIGALDGVVKAIGAERVRSRIEAIGDVLGDPRAELLVAGRTSTATIGWLESHARCRVRAVVEERGLRASTDLAVASAGSAATVRRHPPCRRRPPRSVLGMVLERDGPAALGPRLAELADAALVDSRVLLADRLGVDEALWPRPETRYASDLLDADGVDDAWLAALTRSATDAAIPVLLGGHTLVGPGLRLVAAT